MKTATSFEAFRAWIPRYVKRVADGLPAKSVGSEGAENKKTCC